MQLSSFAPEFRETTSFEGSLLHLPGAEEERGKRREPGNEVEILSRITYLERVTSNDQS